MHYIVVHSGLNGMVAPVGDNCLVRVRISITLPDDLLKTIDRANRNRSAFLERAARAYLAGLEKTKRDARDVAIIEVHADRLNQEAMDVLDYQAGRR